MTQPPPPIRPSWTVPILAGAFATCLLFAPTLFSSLFWLPLCCCAPLVGAPIGMLPAGLALKHDPYMGATSGFAVAFIAVGIGSLVVAVISLLHGFHIDEAAVDELRKGWLERGYKQDEIEQMVEVLHSSGPLMVVMAAAFNALCAGVMGAVLASWTDRRHRRRGAGPSVPR